ncbi:hypothetical protein N7468_003836 [Penicillium chermesinum]|uniref:Uncharacterized protein n=1 Tax=Penicillium chermesinum TaxID=63820 RepID=A0A9W9PA28_9EURO|nr:uncharacterized protein N7468_003836 [Penicillium chermesinum]KAJ5239217.1 hypothetical protein N7468_003836 [Penicillium chermesinum]
MRPRPIGQFPSDLEYRSVRIVKPRSAISDIERKRKRAELDDPLDSEEYHIGMPLDAANLDIPYLVGSNTPAPSSEDSVHSASMAKRVKTGSLHESVRGSKEKSNEGKSGKLSHSLATPISEGRSPTPFDTTPLDTPRVTPMVESQEEIPASQPVASMPSAGTLAASKGVDYVAWFQSLPKPTSGNEADVAALSELVEHTIASAQKSKKDRVAISLLYYWWSIACTLRRRPPSDEKMTKALHSVLYVNASKAQAWFEKYVSENTSQPDGHTVRESSLTSSVTESRQPVRAESLKLSEVYNGTGGKELTDLFNAGKINTAPLPRRRNRPGRTVRSISGSGNGMTTLPVKRESVKSEYVWRNGSQTVWKPLRFRHQ